MKERERIRSQSTASSKFPLSFTLPMNFIFPKQPWAPSISSINTMLTFGKPSRINEIMKETYQESNVTPSSKRSTWVAFLPFLYLVGFMLMGIFLFWTEALDEPNRNWVKILFSSLFYLIVGGIGFFSVSIYTFYRLVKDRALFLAVQRHWPLLLAVLYFFIPNLPGPVDEIVVSTIMGALATYLGLKSESNSKPEKK